MNTKTAIIGGGASGMTAAIASAKNKNNVTIFEKNEKLGKKILITGNGRCNITNKNVTWENYNGTYPKFAASVLARFDNNKTIEFFDKLGLILIEEDKGRLFPRSNQAQSVIDCLEHELNQLKVNIKLNQKIKSVEHKNKKFTLITYQNKKYIFDKLIIATGGRTYPKTGSTGDGYRLARNLGHKIMTIFPVSIPFRIKNVICNKLQGIKVVVELKIYNNNKLLTKNTGELLFTHLGISAPVVLESSREVSEIIFKEDEYKLNCSINFFPEYSQEELFNILKKRLKQNQDKNIGNQFIGILPKKVAPTVLKHSDIDPEQKSLNISNKTLDQIIKILTNLRFEVLDVLGWDTAQFTAGGVDVKKIESKTMESKIVPNLYFCGEVVDIDGQSGGYNLQWAWSSGYIAGNN